MGYAMGKIAYLIGVHRHLELFKRVFRAVYDPADYFLVHVDRKTSVGYHAAVADFLRAYANASVLPSMKVTWGGWNMVELQLAGMRRLLELGDDWSFFTNLSGQCFPLKTPARIRAALATKAGRNFVDVYDLEKHWPYGMIRVRYPWIKIPGLPIRRPVRIPIRRRYLEGVRPYHGSSWFTVSRAFCEYVVGHPDVKRFEDYYKWTVCADEGFFQTVLMHSPFRDTVEPYRRAIVWTGGSSPKTWTLADRDALLASEDWYARKFDPDVDARIVDVLEDHLNLTARSPV